MKTLAIIAAALAVVGLLAGALSGVLAWNGATNVELRFHVSESERGPVKGAKIMVIEQSALAMLSGTNFSGALPQVITDNLGHATVRVRCPASGGGGLFGKNGRFRFIHEVSVEAEGYRTLSTPLANVAGGVRHPLSKKVLDVDLILFKNP